MLIEQELEERIRIILKELSVPVGSLGFEYMSQAIKNKYAELACSAKQTKRNYAELMEQFGVPYSKIDYHIRSAVSKMYQRKECNGVIKYFGENSMFQKQKPRPKRVIEELARYIAKEESQRRKGII